jgi:hypothetical protein
MTDTADNLGTPRAGKIRQIDTAAKRAKLPTRKIRTGTVSVAGGAVSLLDTERALQAAFGL